MKNLCHVRTAAFIWTMGSIFMFVNAFGVDKAHAQENEITCLGLLKLSLGIAVAFAIHEGAHGLAAEVAGEDLEWETGTINQPVGFTGRIDSEGKGVLIYSAGLTSQVIGSEVILQAESIDKNTPFVRGIMAWNIINPIWYALDYWTIHRTNWQAGGTLRGDLEGIEYFSGKGTANAFAIGFAAIAAFQGYRFVKTQSWAPRWLRGDLQGLNVAPMPSKGVLIRYTIPFE